MAIPSGVTRDWVQLLLSSSHMRSTACASSFKKYAQRSEGKLHEEDTLAFCQEVCSKLGIAIARTKLEEAVSKVHRKSNVGISLDEFSQFFDRFLQQLSTQLPKAPTIDAAVDGAINETAIEIEVVEQFQGIVDRGEWSGMIHISVEDSSVVQHRV